MGWSWQQAIAPEGQAVWGVQQGGQAWLCLLPVYYHGPLTTHSTPDLPQLQSCRPPWWSSPGSLGCMRTYDKGGLHPKVYDTHTPPCRWALHLCQKVASVPITQAACVTRLLLTPRK